MRRPADARRYIYYAYTQGSEREREVSDGRAEEMNRIKNTFGVGGMLGARTRTRETSVFMHGVREIEVGEDSVECARADCVERSSRTWWCMGACIFCHEAQL